jgi:uncharacterized protein with PQ loop repeat
MVCGVKRVLIPKMIKLKPAQEMSIIKVSIPIINKSRFIFSMPSFYIISLVDIELERFSPLPLVFNYWLKMIGSLIKSEYFPKKERFKNAHLK